MKTKLNNFLILLSTTLVLASCGNSEPERSVKPQGKVKLESINIAPKIAGRVESIRVHEGQHVQEGDTLAVISVPEIAAKLQQAEGALAAATGQWLLASNGASADQLVQMQSQLDASLAQMDFAEKTFQRMENMYIDSLIPAQKYDEAQSKYNMAQAQVKALEAKQKEILSGTRIETIQSAKGQMMQAEGARNEVLQAEKERFIISPIAMVIETINLAEGELATPGYALISGINNQTTYFRFTIGENVVNAYSLGQEVSISIPNTDKTIASKIVAVKQMARYADNTSTAPNRQVGEGFYEIKISPKVAAEAAELYNNSTVFIEK